MARTLVSTLASLRDVDGIVGSFVVSSDGDLVAQDLPAYFADAAEQVAPRVLRLREALSLSEGTVSSCTVRYANHKLSIRSVQGAILVVLAAATVNAPALRTAMNLVARQCASQDWTNPGDVQVATAAPPQVGPPPSSQPPASSPPPVAQPAPFVGTSTLPSIPMPEVQAALEAAASRPPAPPIQGPDMGEPTAPRKERAIYFRGKRVT